MSDEVAAPNEAQRQVSNDTSLELMADVEPVAAVVKVDVEGVLSAEEGVGVALAGSIVLVGGPSVVSKELEAVRKALVGADDQFVIVPVAKAGQCTGTEDGKGAVRRKSAKDQGTSCWTDSCTTRLGGKDCAPKLICPGRDKVPLPVRCAETACLQTPGVHVGVIDGDGPIASDLMLDADSKIRNARVAKGWVDVADGRAPNDAVCAHLVDADVQTGRIDIRGTARRVAAENGGAKERLRIGAACCWEEDGRCL